MFLIFYVFSLAKLVGIVIGAAIFVVVVCVVCCCCCPFCILAKKRQRGEIIQTSEHLKERRIF